MPGCAAIGCNNRSEKGYTMKCFPRDPALRTLWTEKVSRADWIPSKNSFLCHVHFDSKQWVRSHSGRIKLKRNAVPSIFTVTSTRKSLRKRRKLTSYESRQGLLFDDYLDDSDCSALITARRTLYGRFATKIAVNSRAINAMRDQAKPQETIVVSDDEDDAKNGDDRVKNVGDAKNTTEVEVKPEAKPRVESDQDLDDIERKLRWICDGESQPEDKTKIEKIPAKKNGKIVTSGASVDEKSSCPRLNGEANEKEAKMKEATNRKRRSRYEIMRDIENTVDAENPPNGINVEKQKEEKPRVDVAAPRESRFTIKVTGMDEDVSEIVRSLGSEPIYQYKSSSQSTRNRRGFVTSVISVIDRPAPSNSNELLKPKVEIEESPSAETKADWNWQIPANESLKKITVESPNDDENPTTCRQLRKKVKFQEEVIRTLTKQLVDSKNVEAATEKPNAEADDRVTAVKRPFRDHQREKDNLLKDLSERVIQSEEINKSLNRQLVEKNRQTKKLEWQIRQRDNRIKELNWKLEKASKYLERAEKNTNTYRKKMINMQNVLSKRIILEEKNLSRDSAVVNASEPEVAPETAKIAIKEEELNDDDDENTVYETVQDIFDESNDCDDDPSVIDTREDFLREFEGAL